MTSNTESAGQELLRNQPLRAHSTPDPEDLPPDRPPANPPPVPDDDPLPAHAPVEEPRLPEPPIRAG
jgi:hypothetical protein